MARKMWFIGENGYRRSSPDAYVRYVECINNNVTEDSIKKCLLKRVYNSNKNPEDMKRGLPLMRSLGLIKKNKLSTTKYGLELISDDKDWKFSAMTKMEFTFLKSLLYYSKIKNKNNFWIVKSIFMTLLEARKIRHPLTLAKCLMDSQPNKRKEINLDNILDEETFARAYCKDMNAGENKKICQNYWANYINIIKKISISGITLNTKKILIENIRNFRNQVKYKKKSHNQFLLIDKFWSKFKKRTYDVKKLQNWVDNLTHQDFVNLYNKEKLSQIINFHLLNYSSSDNIDITQRNLKLLPFFNITSSKIVSIKPEYISFIEKLVANWELVILRIDPEKDFSFQELLNLLEIADFSINKKSIKEIINEDIGEEKIDLFLKLFQNHPHSISRIEDNLKNIGYSTNIESYVYFEYFVGLKIIHLSNFELDENIFNLKLDSFLKPQSHAPGGKPDIYGIFDNQTFMVEVTLLKGRSQNKNESEPIKNHYVKFKPDHCFFIAPTIDRNVINDLHNGYYVDDDFFETNTIKLLKIKDFAELRQISDFFDY